VKRVWQALAMLGVVVAVGTIGYHTLEDMTILDALYMTVTTVSTVGFGEVHPLSHRGRAFTIGLILFEVSTMAWAAESTVEALLEDHIRHA
jgi:voltage-gated potassium channel